MRAVCSRCGGQKPDFDHTCPTCGFRPDGDGLLVAWLLSTHHRDADQLDAIAGRIRAGEVVKPSRRMLDQARRALGRSWATDQGMTRGQRTALIATSLFLTPLVGWVLAGWWREQRPRAALQALALSLPASVLFFGLGLWMMATG